MERLKRLTSINSHEFIYGLPGTGKTTVMKNEIEEILKNTTDDVIIIAPSHDGDSFENIIKNYNGVTNYLDHNSILNLCDVDKSTPFEIVLEEKRSIFKTFFDMISYNDYFDDIKEDIDKFIEKIYTEDKIFTLKDLYDSLSNEDAKLCLEMFAIGTFERIFANPTAMTKSRVTLFKVPLVNRSLVPLYYLPILDYIYGLVNKERKNKAWVFFSENYLVYKDENLSRVLKEIFTSSINKDVFLTFESQSPARMNPEIAFIADNIGNLTIFQSSEFNAIEDSYLIPEARATLRDVPFAYVTVQRKRPLGINDKVILHLT